MREIRGDAAPCPILPETTQRVRILLLVSTTGGRTSGACPNYVVDHIVPLKRGRADEPANIWWQEKQTATAEDRIE